MSDRKSGDALGVGCLVLFAAPFAFAGAAILYQGLFKPEAQDEPLWVILTAGLLFLSVGVGLAAFALIARGAHQKELRLQERFPDEPWKWRPEWESGSIPNDQSSGMFTGWAIALFWNGITALTIGAAWREVSHEPWFPVLMLFPLVGAGLLYWALKETVRHFRHGRAWFEMDRPPGVIGGRLHGIVRSCLADPPAEGFEVTLSCMRVSSSSDSSTEHLRWQAERTVSRGELGRQAGSVVIPVNFEIPRDADPTDETDGGRMRWRLHVGAALPGLDYATDFLVPVFLVPGREESHAADHTFAACTEPVGPPPYQQRVRPDGLMEYHFPSGRNPGAAGAMTLMLLIWMGALAGMLWFEIPWFFILVWALFALLLTWATIELWFSSIQVWFEADDILVRRKLLGWGRTRRVPLADVERVSVKIGMSQGRTMTQTARAWYDVNLHMGTRTVTAGGAIADKGHAERFAERLRRRIQQFRNRGGLHIEN